ncbi:MAG: hypothetical protein ACJAR8_001050 [Bacteroidia bacterium]|jgi:hypothetical protein
MKAISKTLIISILFVVCVLSSPLADGRLGFILFSLAFLCAALLIIISITLVFSYLVGAPPSNLKPLITVAVALLIAWANPMGRIIEAYKSPIVFVGVCEHTVAGVKLTLRKDFSFEYSESSMFNSVDHSGTYTEAGDTITLKFGQMPDTLISSTLKFHEAGLLEYQTSEHEHLHLFKNIKKRS